MSTTFNLNEAGLLEFNPAASREVEALQRNIADRDRTIQSYEKEITAYQREKSKLAKQLNELLSTPKKIFNLEDIENKLLKFEGYIPNSFNMGYRQFDTERGIEYVTNSKINMITFAIDNIICRPSYNRYQWINNGAQNVYVNLYPVRVTIDIDQEKIYWHWYEKIEKPANYPLNFPHPHIIERDGQACLGSHMGHIVPHIAEMDIEMLYVHCRRFLSQATDEDLAGQKWISHLKYKIQEKYGEIQINYSPETCIIQQNNIRKEINIITFPDGTYKITEQIHKIRINFSKLSPHIAAYNSILNACVR